MGPLGVQPVHPPELQARIKFVSQVFPRVAKFKRYRLRARGIIGLELRPHLSSRLATVQSGVWILSSLHLRV